MLQKFTKPRNVKSLQIIALGFYFYLSITCYLLTRQSRYIMCLVRSGGGGTRTNSDGELLRCILPQQSAKSTAAAPSPATAASSFPYNDTH